MAMYVNYARYAKKHSRDNSRRFADSRAARLTRKNVVGVGLHVAAPVLLTFSHFWDVRR